MDDADDIFDTDLGFDKIAVGTELFTALALVFGAEGGHHNDADVFRLGRGAQDVEEVKTTNLRHHHIAHDELWTLFDGHGEGFFTVTS